MLSNKKKNPWRDTRSNLVIKKNSKEGRFSKEEAVPETFLPRFSIGRRLFFHCPLSFITPPPAVRGGRGREDAAVDDVRVAVC